MNLLQLFLLVLEHGQLGCDIWNSETPKLRLQVKKEHGETCDHGMRSLKLKTAAWLSISRIQIIFCRCPDTSKTQLHMLPFFHFPETPTLKLLIRRGVCYTMCYVKTDSLDLITHTHTKGPCAVVLYWKRSQQLQQLMACCYSTPCLRPLHNAHPGNGGSHRYKSRDSTCCVESKHG